MLAEIKKIIKFGGIGFIATTVHACVFTFIYTFFLLNTVLSNIIAFIFALGISYAGHSYFTFRDQVSSTELNHALRLRFLLTALSGLVFNIFWAYLFIDVLHLNILFYSIGGLYILTPLSTYLLYRIWVYGKYHSQ